MKRDTIGNVIVYPAKGGLETISVPGTTTLGRLASGKNFLVDINGAKKKHPGTISVGPSYLDPNGQPTSPPLNGTQGLMDFWRTNVSSKVRRTTLVADGKVWADNGDSTYNDVTGAFNLLSTDNVTIETFFGLMVLAFENNPAGVPLKWDQSALANLGGTPPNGKYLRTWFNRLWIAGNPAAPDRLYASVPDNPEDWLVINGAEVINIDQGDQDPIGITSLFPPFYGRMFVGKRRSIYEVTPASTTFAIREIVRGLGCLSHNGVQSVDSDIFFPSERGISSMMMTNKLGQVDTAFASQQIQDFYQETISFERADNMRSIYVPELNMYLLALTSKFSASNDLVFGYNFQLGEWFVWEENVAAFSKYVDPNDANKTKVLVADDQGRIGILDTSRKSRTVTWFGERRTMQFATGIIYPLGVRKEVTFRSLTVYFKPQTTDSELNVSYFVNSKFVSDLSFPMAPIQGNSLIGSAIIGVDKIGIGGTIKHVTRELKGNGDGIELVFTHTPKTDDEDCEIYGFVIEYEYAGETNLPKQQ